MVSGKAKVKRCTVYCCIPKTSTCILCAHTVVILLECWRPTVPTQWPSVLLRLSFFSGSSAFSSAGWRHGVSPPFFLFLSLCLCLSASLCYSICYRWICPGLYCFPLCTPCKHFFLSRHCSPSVSCVICQPEANSAVASLVGSLRLGQGRTLSDKFRKKKKMLTCLNISITTWLTTSNEHYSSLPAPFLGDTGGGWIQHHIPSDNRKPAKNETTKNPIPNRCARLRWDLMCLFYRVEPSIESTIQIGWNQHTAVSHSLYWTHPSFWPIRLTDKLLWAVQLIPLANCVTVCLCCIQGHFTGVPCFWP